MTIFHANPTTHSITGLGQTHPASFGKGGYCPAPDKREGDGKTPLGLWPIRAALLRPDRLPTPRTALPWRWLRPWDGWSDAITDPAYNRPVFMPHPFSAESLWRDDHAYDLILILAHNDAPPTPGLGSAIFWHCRQPDGRPTEGCAAQDRETLFHWLEAMAPGDAVSILAA
ncbi:L,D-transpeptidase family protein [Sandarakinorhabdus sp.]|uniref:L,D-transpeptidase family protein n=1 Tax=Sandarakinorhabdus sp. TaxID=1916663 RepID=UPI003342DCF8